jgi:predicted dehydrogenase
MVRLGVAIIGLGIGRRHLEAYRTAPGVEVVAVCAGSARSVEEAQARYGVPHGATDYRAVIARDDVNLVSICSPDRLHAEQAAFAMEQGKHVLVEKPIATSLEEVTRLAAVARQTGRTFMAGHNYRFIPQFAGLRDLAAQGELGRLYLAEASYVQDLGSLAARGADYWRFADPQDFFLGGAIHLIDILRWVCGEVAEIQAYANHAWEPYPGNENYVAALRFASGVVGQVLLALGSRRTAGFRVRFALHGTGGAAESDNVVEQIVVDRGLARGEERGAGAPSALERRPVQPVNSIAAEVADFVRCVREDRPPPVSVLDGARAVAICLAGIRSAREGRPVAIPEE